MTTEAIVANHISKSINHKEIINDLSITIPKHSMTHIQGHNGSGKTITLQLLAQLISPSKGNIKVNGRISYAPDYLPNDLNLTVREYLSFIRHLNHLHINDQYLNNMISNMHLEPFLSHRLKIVQKEHNKR